MKAFLWKESLETLSHEGQNIRWWSEKASACFGPNLGSFRLPKLGPTDSWDDVANVGICLNISGSAQISTHQTCVQGQSTLRIHYKLGRVLEAEKMRAKVCKTGQLEMLLNHHCFKLLPCISQPTEHRWSCPLHWTEILSLSCSRRNFNRFPSLDRVNFV